MVLLLVIWMASCEVLPTRTVPKSSDVGEKAMVAFAMEWLTKLFGNDLAAAVKKSSVTRWNASPFVLGAMSVAAPGGQPSRKILTEPAGNLFLAGEATHETLWGTVDGAWESGERAAEAALRKIGALTDPSAGPERTPAQRRRTRGAAPRPLFDAVAAELGAGDFDLYVKTSPAAAGPIALRV